MGTDPGPGSQSHPLAIIMNELIQLAKQLAKADRQIWEKENSEKLMVLPSFAYDKFEASRYTGLLENIIEDGYDADTLKRFLRSSERKLQSFRNPAPEANTEQERTS